MGTLRSNLGDMQSGQHMNGQIDTPAFDIGLAELSEGMKRQLGHLFGEHTHQPVKAMKTNCEITFQSLTPETLLQLLSMLSLLVLLSFGLCRETCSQKQQGKSCGGFILGKGAKKKIEKKPNKC